MMGLKVKAFSLKSISGSQALASSEPSVSASTAEVVLHGSIQSLLLNLEV